MSSSSCSRVRPRVMARLGRNALLRIWIWGSICFGGERVGRWMWYCAVPYEIFFDFHFFFLFNYFWFLILFIYLFIYLQWALVSLANMSGRFRFVYVRTINVYFNFAFLITTYIGERSYHYHIFSFCRSSYFFGLLPFPNTFKWFFDTIFIIHLFASDGWKSGQRGKCVWSVKSLIFKQLPATERTNNENHWTVGISLSFTICMSHVTVNPGSHHQRTVRASSQTPRCVRPIHCDIISLSTTSAA